MDFHSLTRKELQTLCKRNKIPANITNVAMADALKALEIVEGLDEFMNQSQSPEKTMNESSQDVPSTVTRTSTRRKTTKEPQSTQPTIRTQRMTRRTMELGEENKNVNVPETPAIATTTTRRRAQKTESEAVEQKKSDLLETPALQSGRRRPGVGSTRRKVEAQKDMSVQQGYGTRRSVRLLQKCMAGLSLKDGERMEPEKIDGIEENKNGQSEAPAEVPLARNLSESLEDERDLEDVLENSKYDSDGNEAGSQKTDNLDSKDTSPDEKTVDSDAYLAKSTANKLADTSDRTIDPKGSDDVAASEDSDENDNTDKELVAENKGGSHADETKSIEVPVSGSFEEISEEALDHSEEIPVSADKELVAEYNGGSHADEKSIGILVADTFEEISDHSSSADKELVAEYNGGSHADEKSIGILVADTFEEISEEALDHSSSEELMEPVGFVSGEECAVSKDCDINVAILNDDLAKLPEAEEYDGGKESHMDSFEKMENEESDNNSLPDELQVSCEQESILIPIADSSEDPMNILNEEALVDVNVAEEINHVVVESSFQNAPKSVVSEIPIPKMLDYGDAEALIDVAVNALIDVAEEINHVVVESSFQNAPKSVVSEIPIPKMLDYGDAEALIDVAVNPAEEFEETLQEIPPAEKSPTAATSVPLSSLTAQFSQPTHFTPRKSSGMKQKTIPKVISDNNNKENIDNSMKVEPNLGKVKQSKNIIDEETMQKLESLSLRNLKKLTKMFDKLQITDNKQPLGKTRPALQTLPQNCISSGEAEKQN